MAPDTRARRNVTRYVATAGAAVVGGGALAYIGLRDPHAPGFGFPTCPFRLLTGWNCPGCGGLRMTHDLLHGDFGAAVVDNVFMLVGLPMLALWLILRWRSGRKLMPKSGGGGRDRRRGGVDGGPQPARVPAGPDVYRRVASRLR